MSESTNAGALTPLMAQYKSIKDKYADSILFFRLGDFYEMFGEDAITAAPILEVALTKRQSVPMCGVPHHSSSGYIAKLLKKGFKVSICEQKDAADTQGSKKIFQREVVRVITPGTIIEENILKPKVNNFLCAINPAFKNNQISALGLVFADISTGKIESTEITEKIADTLDSELAKHLPAEIILPTLKQPLNLLTGLLGPLDIPITYADEWDFNPAESELAIKQKFGLNSLSAVGLENKILSLGAINALLKFIKRTQPGHDFLLKRPRYYSCLEYLSIDSAAIENLELLPKNNGYNSSLLEVLDQTVTSIGGRLFRKWMLSPLTNIEKIKSRQDYVSWFANHGIKRSAFREELKSCSDVERILSRLSADKVFPRELNALKQSLESIPALISIIENDEPINNQLPGGCFGALKEALPLLSKLQGYLSDALAENMPSTFKQGGYIKNGFSAELDELKKIAAGSKQVIAEIENKERRITGINNLKVGYTNVFGYYIEVTKSYLGKVPASYIRKQTLTNAERFTTVELRDYEFKVLGAEDKILNLEEELFVKIRQEILSFRDILLSSFEIVGELDCYSSLAEMAVKNNYCLPEISAGSILEIKEGRHPVVEKNINSKESFIANDIYMDGIDSQVLLVTGPNMSGKSTYLRQCALIVIMAQMGSYVPAEKAHIGIVDQIFTRIGASDNLARGESTFMVEMRETSTIINNLSPRSLVILDEVGRGTSTYDGISIAWAILEYLANYSPVGPSGSRPKTLFATHYFELTELEKKLRGVLNYNVSVKEWGDKIIFLKKIARGSADRSYGIHVAKLAGLPDEIIKRASEILSGLEDTRKSAPAYSSQIELFDGAQKIRVEQQNPFIVELQSLNTDELTPMEALRKIAKWKEKLLNGL